MMINNYKQSLKFSHSSNYKNKKVLVLGLGINQGGVGAARFFASQGAKVRVTDLKQKEELQVSLDQLREFPDIEYTLGEHKYEDLDWADLIIRNPALKPDNQYLLYATEKGKIVEMDMGIFLEHVKPSQIIGVTGTKGKSTTASLIFEVLKNNKEDILFAGNIGKSVLDTVPFIKEDSLIILELSSFQLQAFEQHQISPKYSVITNIYPDHLNYHGTIENYIEAKRTIAKYQDEGGFIFLNKGDEETNKDQFLGGLRGQIIYYSPEDIPQDVVLHLPGEHNKTNAAAALQVAIIFHVPDKKSLEAIKNFRGVEFRLQLIKEVNGVKIYNDTAATNPKAAIENIKSLPNSIVIVGGANKGLDYQEMAENIAKYAKAVYFLEGDASQEILKHLLQIPNTKFQIPNKMYNNSEDILSEIKPTLEPNDVILFSPGAASFNLFKNEFDRGRKFNEAVEKIFS